ncbi:hypothetical protein [Aquabacterium sp. J223]|uniref:hypothetical protein n=1 Tax=Aquabacterium sp. J223 TaxID=2898431 RepID=UPI0021ADE62A|nr:hypothetical protein [Aquabacterium sp. J223]UUX96770.1 hypothetical protein LRS07_05665 [Aquabacterium sp. J223]
MTQIFTITARNYLSLALTLGQSVAQHHSEIVFTIFIADGLDGVEDVQLPNGHRLLDARAVLPPSVFMDLAFKYDVTEFCTSFKPTAFSYLFDEDPNTDMVFYLDPDTRLYGRLDPIVNAAPSKTLFLAPHLLDCRVADDNPYPEYHHLWEGIFNLGFCALRRTETTPKVLQWWDARLREYCYADHTDGLHTDQKWMDYAPVYFIDDLHVVRHRGANVAHWNLVERPLTLQGDSYFAGPDPLIFFHFSGFNFKGKTLNKLVDAQAQQAYGSAELDAFAEDYRQAVKRNGYDRFIGLPYGHGAFDDGTPVSKPHRRLYRSFVRNTPVSQPFSASGNFYCALRAGGLLDRSAAASANYSKATVGNLSQKLRLAGSCLRWVARALGFKRYAQMVKLFAHLGRFENHGFLVDDRR